MRKLVPILFLLAALAATGVALSSGGPNEKLVSQTRLYGGGTFDGCATVELPFCLPQARSFALDAHVEGHGDGAAYGTWEYGPANGPWHIRGEIRCVKVVGNTALVGGVVTESDRPDVVGLTFATYVRDNGTQSSGAPDQASIGWFGDDFPGSFPETCPASGVLGIDVAPPVWFDLNGDVVVQQ